jgi:hypothetical protein
VSETTVVAEPLAQLYSKMQHLTSIAEETRDGTTARAARAAQLELWEEIRRLGGSQKGYIVWRGLRHPGV